MKQALYSFIAFLFLGNLATAQTYHWSTHIDTSTTFSSPRATDLNGDGTLDIVIGGGLDGSAENRGVVAIDGATGTTLWEFRTDEEIRAFSELKPDPVEGEKK